MRISSLSDSLLTSSAYLRQGPQLRHRICGMLCLEVHFIDILFNFSLLGVHMVVVVRWIDLPLIERSKKRKQR